MFLDGYMDARQKLFHFLEKEYGNEHMKYISHVHTSFRIRKLKYLSFKLLRNHNNVKNTTV